MAGRGFPPKPASARRNRTKPARGEWVDLPPLEQPVLPELPALADEEWRQRTRDAWEAWRSDPVTALWSPSDVDYALDTILLHHSSFASKAAEIRLRMDALGLTPKGKRDLRWRLAESGKPTEELPRLAEVRRLRAVDTKAAG